MVQLGTDRLQASNVLTTWPSYSGPYSPTLSLHHCLNGFNQRTRTECCFLSWISPSRLSCLSVVPESVGLVHCQPLPNQAAVIEGVHHPNLTVNCRDEEQQHGKCPQRGTSPRTGHDELRSVCPRYVWTCPAKQSTVLHKGRVYDLFRRTRLPASLSVSCRSSLVQAGRDNSSRCHTCKV